MSNYNKFARHQLTKISHLPQCYNTPDTAILHKTSLPEFCMKPAYQGFIFIH